MSLLHSADAVNYPSPAVNESSVSLTVNSSADMYVAPITGSKYGAVNSPIVVTTNNSTGHTTTLSSSTADNALHNELYFNTKIDSLPIGVSKPLTANSWGYTLNFTGQVNDTSAVASNNFNAIPVSSELIAHSNEPVESSSTSVYYGTYLTHETVAGKYSNTVVYTTVANYVAPPIITSVAPDSGTQAGGTNLYITGTGFDSLINIKIGDEINGYSDCIDVSILSDTTATCTTTASATFGLKDVIVKNQGGSDTLENGYTYIPEKFVFTVDTRMTDTLDIDPSHYSGASTEFRIPTGKLWNTYSYNWDVNCDSQNFPEAFVNYTGVSSENNDGILCNYSVPGEYQITIRASANSLNQYKNIGALPAGWLNAFGFIDGGGLANEQANKNLFKSIDSNFTRLSIYSGRWASNMFGPMFRGAKNAIGIPAGLFDNIDLSNGGVGSNGMLRDTFRDYAYNSTTASIPSGLFDFIATANGDGGYNAVFSGTFKNFAYNSANATIPAELFDLVDTSKTSEMSEAFHSTFEGYAKVSTTGNIPSGLFDAINTSNAISVNKMFDSTFFNFASESTTGTIPAGLFDGVNVNKTDNASSMFNRTFMDYAVKSSSGNIPNNLFGALNTGNATDLHDLFSFTFESYARDSTSGTIPAGLFSGVDTSSATNIESIFRETFKNYATNSSVSIIPAGLFSGVDTSSATNCAHIFSQTFAFYAKNSTGTIPVGLFSAVNTANAIRVDGAFYQTFVDHARSSTTGTIPAGLFDGISTSVAENMNNTFNGTFLGYANNSTTGTIPAGLLSGVNTTNATNTDHLFYDMFNTYAHSSIIGSIPVNLFNGVDLLNSNSYGGMFGQTFLGYAEQNVFDGINDTDINNIWGAADFADKVTADNADNIFKATFDSMLSLTGYAQSFIDNYIGVGIVPNSPARTFYNTNVNDYSSLNPNWKN